MTDPLATALTIFLLACTAVVLLFGAVLWLELWKNRKGPRV